VTHGYEAVMVRWLAEQGLQAGAFATEYGDQGDDAEPAAGTPARSGAPDEAADVVPLS
jgi:putative mRNA 3-end processing factor